MSSNLSSSFHQFKFNVAKTNGHSIYLFDGFRLESDKLMLFRGDLPTALPPKAVETLAVLVSRRGEIVPKDELIDEVWKDSVVEESNLTQYLYLIRKTLGQRSNGEPYIETLRKRGYRFDSDGFEAIPAQSPIRESLEPESADLHGANVLTFHPKGRSIGRDRLTEKLPSDPKSWSALVGAMTAILGIAIVGAVVWLNLGASTATEQERERNVLRLTNGIEPRGATISPDGKYFVYHESGPEYRMWLQQTGYSTRVEIIPASKSALCCTTFSPDDQFVYYLASDSSGEPNTLYRVPALGGTASKIASNVSSAVSFSPDGREMVYSRFDKQKNETQYVVRGSDGSGDERIIHRSAGSYSTGPAWSPDGKTVAFAKSSSGEDGDYVLHLLNLADGSVKPLSEESWDMCHRIMWTADGRGFYFIGTKKGERLTPHRDQLYYVSHPAGRSRRITIDPTSRQQPDSLGVTNDGSVLTVPYNRASQIWVMNANGDSRSAEQLTSGISDGRAGMALLADGRLAFIGRAGDNTSLLTMNQDGSDHKAFLADPVIPDEPRSSPGSPYLVFSVYDWPYSHLFRAHADGSEMTQLTFGKSREVDSSISHDGKWVAYGSLSVPVTDVEISLWKISMHGGEPIRLKKGNCLMPHFSPDDRMLSCVEDQKTIHILSASDGSVIRSIPVTRLAWLNSGARWTPDGKSVAYIVTENGISNIWLHPIDGGEPRPLTDFKIASIYNFIFSADGSRMFLARGQQIRDAILIQNPR